MTPMTVRGVPRSLQQDAWWIAADSQTGVGSGQGTVARPWLGLFGIVVLLDVLLLHTHLGLGFVAAILSVAGAAHWMLRGSVSAKSGAGAWGVLIVALIPALVLVQALSVAIALIGVTLFAGLVSGPRWWQAAKRLPQLGFMQWGRDLRATELRGPSRTLFLDWLLPVCVGLVFVVLMFAANPLVEAWISGLDLAAGPAPERVVMWGVFALLVWPFLRLAQMQLHKPSVKSLRKPMSVAYLNPRSVMRALVLFNVIFAVQTVLDLGYLWGGIRLPEGMSYAAYAHRGAYPLMATALLAGGFALVAQPWLDGRLMRALLIVWVVQTMLLVISSILRLDLYVDAYGLTHMRFAAFVWMAVVALGLIVLLMQIVRGYSAGWMLARSFGVGAVAVYLCTLVNVSGYVARHQLTKGPLDAYYVCSLDHGAAVERARHGLGGCNAGFEPAADLREWGFRNWNLHRNLALLEGEAGQ